MLRIVSGQPTAEEIAALITVLATLRADADPPTPAQVGGWADRGRGLRRPIRPGPAAWRLSGRE